MSDEPITDETELTEEEAAAAVASEEAKEAAEHGEQLGRLFAPRIKAVAAKLAEVMAAEVMSRPVGPAGMPPSLAGEMRLSDEVRAAILAAATQIVCTDVMAARLSGIAAPLQAVAGMILDEQRQGPALVTPSGPVQLNNPNRVNGRRKGKRK